VTEKQRKRLLTFLKLFISAALIYFIFNKINLKDVLTTLKTSNLLYLLIALISFAFSKLIAAFRLNLYFHEIGVKLTQKSNLKLYLLGMFYRAFSIGIPLSIIVFWYLNKQFFNYVLPVFWKSVGYSVLVQLSQLIAAWSILKALSIQMDTVAYLFVFLISSIVSVLPLTIGGIGSREITFLYGAKWLNLNANTSVSISLVFFLITALVSLFGIYYHFKKPKLENNLI